MGELVRQFAKTISDKLGAETLTLLALCILGIYAWYQHLRNRLLTDQIASERQRRRDFLKEAKALRARPRIQASGTAYTERILVVDDEASVGLLFSAYLAEHNPEVQVDTARDGAEALEKVLAAKPSLIVTDVVMPRMSGVDLLKALQDRGIRTPAIVISGYTDYEELLTEFSDQGVDPSQIIQFLRKPWAWRAFGEALEKSRRSDAGRGGSGAAAGPGESKKGPPH
jgi:CheY-like chemotaxis protein